MAKKKTFEYGSTPNGFLYWGIGCGIAITISRFIFGLKIRRDKEVCNMPGPLICVGNHPSYLDPIIMATLLYGRRINFVAGSFIFRNRVIGPLFIRGGCIPKMQYQSDSRAVKGMLKTLKSNGTLGIFPEATRLVDGTSINFDDALARMIKKTGSAIAVMSSHGSYMSWPRWTKSGFRRGRITANIKSVLTSERVADMSVAQIHEYLLEQMRYNEYEWFAKHPRHFKNRAIAAGAENIAHACPKCNKNNVMLSEKNMLICSNCGNCAVMLTTGFFRAGNPDDVIFEDLHQWVIWQKKRTEQAVTAPDFQISEPTDLHMPIDDFAFALVGQGVLSVRDGCIYYDGTQCDQDKGIAAKKLKAQDREAFLSKNIDAPKVSKCFPIERLRGVKVSYGKFIELNENDGQMNRFLLRNGQRVYEIQTAIQALQKSDKVN